MLLECSFLGYFNNDVLINIRNLRVLYLHVKFEAFLVLQNF